MVPRPQLEFRQRRWISPARPTDERARRVPLSNWDVVMFKSYTPLLLFYCNTENTSDFMDTQTLTNSLSNVLCDFSPLAGRLVDVGEGRDEIDCNDAGVLFQEAFYQEELDKFRKDGFLPNQLDYHRMFPIHFYSSNQDPLLAIQITRFQDGGVALGLMMLHKVADVYSTCLFMDAWAKSARGVDYRLATFRRELVAAPPNAAITDEAIAYYRDEHRVSTVDAARVCIDPDQKKYARTSINGPKPLKSVILEFYSDGLHQCKRDAHTQDMINNKNWLSTKDALIAMLLRAIVRSRPLERQEEVKLVLGVNGRSKMKNSKDMESYFGNWMVARSIVTTRDEVDETMLVDTAVAFQQNIASLRASLFHGLSKLYTLHDDMTVNYLTYQPNSNNHFTASDVSMLPFWRLDFGFGRPDRYRGYITSGGNGCMVIFGRDDSKKGPMYDVQLQMDADSMRRFIDDHDIRKYTKRILY